MALIYIIYTTLSILNLLISFYLYIFFLGFRYLFGKRLCFVFYVFSANTEINLTPTLGWPKLLQSLTKNTFLLVF